MLKIIPVNTDKDIKSVKMLLSEYADSLGFNLDFQDFDKELDNLPGYYTQPDGCLLLAEYHGSIAGCVAMQKINNDICEMKRLYVKPEFRGLKIGKALAISIVNHAIENGYKYMRLDTVKSMKAANTLYGSMGFKNIFPYRYNPLEEAVFMELKLV